MKKLFILCLPVLFFASCSSDNDSDLPDGVAELMGEYRMVGEGFGEDHVEFELCEELFLELYENGDYAWGQFEEGGCEKFYYDTDFDNNNWNYEGHTEDGKVKLSLITANAGLTYVFDTTTEYADVFVVPSQGYPHATDEWWGAGATGFFMKVE